jgi:hypothetical protein
LPIVPLASQGQHSLGRGKGQYFYHVSEEVKGKGLHRTCWKLQKRFGNFRGNYIGRPSRSCESLRMKIIGKSRLSGRKPNVRFDEGELEIELLDTTPALYSTVLLNKQFLNPSPLQIFQKLLLG